MQELRCFKRLGDLGLVCTICIKEGWIRCAHGSRFPSACARSSREKRQLAPLQADFRDVFHDLKEQSFNLTLWAFAPK
jgi:hypothetical protein